MWLEPAQPSPAVRLSVILALETSCDDTCAAVVDGARDPLERDLLAGRGARALRRRRPRGRLAPPPRARQPGGRRGARRGRGRARRRRRARGHPRARADRGAAGRRQHRQGASPRRPRKPLCGVDHLHGHVAANFLEPDPIEPPFLCLIASGGHTLLAGVTRARLATRCSARRSTTPPARRSTRRRGCSASAIRAGRRSSARPRDGDPGAFEFPVAMTNDPRLDFSFSGLKTALLYAVRELGADGHARAARRPRRELPGRGRRPARDQAATRGARRQPSPPQRATPGRRSRSAAGWPRTRCCASGSAELCDGRGAGAEAGRRASSAPTTRR